MLALCQIAGRVSILDKTGQPLATLGTNETKGQINTNRVKPEQWQAGVFTAPHGIAFDKEGNLYITEWNKFGRILRYDLVRN